MEHMTRDMGEIARKTKTETVSMKIITLVTLFFLPGTFISVGLCLFFLPVSYSIFHHQEEHHFWTRASLYYFLGNLFVQPILF